MPANRTQIYITAEQRAKLDARRMRERKTLAAVVRRDAIDAYVGGETPTDVRRVLDETFGIDPRFIPPSRKEWVERGRRPRM